MKRYYFVVLFLISATIASAQNQLFEKNDKNTILSNTTMEKLNILKNKPEVVSSEQLNYIGPTKFTKGYKGMFNFLKYKIEFEITEEFGVDVQGIHGYSAKLIDWGYAVISISSIGISANIFYKELIFNIHPISQKIHLITEINRKQIACDNPYDFGKPRTGQYLVFPTETNTLTAPSIKVLVAYTPAAAQAYPNITTLISQSISATNTAYQNSSVLTRLSLAGSVQVSYTESGSSLTDVNRFMGTNDGYMDNIHFLRTQYEADICVLIVNSLDDCGRVPDNAIPAEYSTSFCVVKLNCAVDNLSFAHEVGHLLGCRHASDPSPEPYTYCHGYQGNWKLYNIKRNYRTIMSIILPDKYQRVPYFSNPYVYDQEGTAMGTATNNNCRLTIDNIAPTIASFQGPKPIISGFTQNPDPIYNGGTGYVYAQLSQGSDVTYTWSETHYPAMTVSLTPRGSSCQLYYYLPYNTNFGIFISCTASNAYGTDVKTYQLHCALYSNYSSVSLAFEKEGVLTDENSILVTSIDNPDVDVTDYYLINNEIIPENDALKFLVHESDQVKGNTYVDQVELWEVKSSKNDFVAVTKEGEVISYNNLGKQNQFILNDSRDITDLLADRDDQKLTVKNGDKITIRQPGNAVDENGDLYGVLFAQLKDEAAYEASNTISKKYYFRSQPSFICRKINKTQSEDLSLEFTEAAIIDYLVIVKDEKTAKIEKLKMLGAVNKEQVDLKELLSSKNASYTKIYPGDKVSFAFESQKAADEKVFYILKTVGRFEQADLSLNKNEKSAAMEIVSEKAEAETMPLKTELLDNYPNPFNPVTQIRYQLKENAFVELTVFNSLGQKVQKLVSGNKDAGYYSAQFDGSSFASGVYIYRLQVGTQVFLKKMLLTK